MGSILAKTVPVDSGSKWLCIFELKADLLFSIVLTNAETKRLIQILNKILHIHRPTAASVEAEEWSAVLCRVKQRHTRVPQRVVGGWGWKVAAGLRSSSSQYQSASWPQSLPQMAFPQSAYSLLTDHQCVLSAFCLFWLWLQSHICLFI